MPGEATPGFSNPNYTKPKFGGQTTLGQPANNPYGGLFPASGQPNNYTSSGYGGSKGDWWKDPDLIAALIKSGTDMAGGYMAGKGQQAMTEAEIAAQALASALQREYGFMGDVLGAEKGLFEGQRGELGTNRQNALAAFGNSPLQFAGDRARMNVNADFMASGVPSNLRAHVPTFMRGMSEDQISAQGLRPTAAMEQGYWENVAKNTGGQAASPNLEGSYGTSGSLVDKRVREAGEASEAADSSAWRDQQEATRAILDRYRESLKSQLGSFGAPAGSIESLDTSYTGVPDASKLPPTVPTSGDPLQGGIMAARRDPTDMSPAIGRRVRPPGSPSAQGIQELLEQWRVNTPQTPADAARAGYGSTPVNRNPTIRFGGR